MNLMEMDGNVQIMRLNLQMPKYEQICICIAAAGI